MLEQNVSLLLAQAGSDLLTLFGGRRGQIEGGHGNSWFDRAYSASCASRLARAEAIRHAANEDAPSRGGRVGRLFVEPFYRKIKAAVRGQQR
jgi:hypothetical protein